MGYLCATYGSCGEVQFFVVKAGARKRLRKELQAADRTLPARVLHRFEVVREALDGEDPRHVGLDHEIPAMTVIRWLNTALEGGLAVLSNLQEPEALLRGMDPDLPAEALSRASPGLERTALQAVAAMCRGASAEEVASHYGTVVAEVRDWIGTYLEFGAMGIRDRFRDSRWSPNDPEQAFLSRRLLPYSMSPSFLRRLHVRCDGELSRRMLAIAFLYEGRTVAQVAGFFGVTLEAAGLWARQFVRRGLPGIAIRGAMGRVPNRNGFGASVVAKMAEEVSNPAMRTRLRIVELAYRSRGYVEIARELGVGISAVKSAISDFESGGFEGLSTGDATLTPELPAQYDAEGLRALAVSLEDDEPARRRLESIALLYDGETMADVGRQYDGLAALVTRVERFVRFGPDVLLSFKASEMAPRRPPLRPAPSPLKANERPLAMRPDINAMRLERVRGAYLPDGQARIDVLIDAYEGRSVKEISSAWEIPQVAVGRWVTEFNAAGLEWLARFRKKRPKPLKQETTKAERGAQTSTSIRVELSDSLDVNAIRSAIARTVEQTHRHELRIVQAVYERGGNINGIGPKFGVRQEEVLRLCAAFDLYGVTLGRKSRINCMLPEKFDRTELEAAGGERGIVGIYARIVAALYSGDRLSNIENRFDVIADELEVIVSAFRNSGIEGLRRDPLGREDRRGFPLAARAAFVLSLPFDEPRTPVVPRQVPKAVAVQHSVPPVRPRPSEHEVVRTAAKDEVRPWNSPVRPTKFPERIQKTVPKEYVQPAAEHKAKVAGVLPNGALRAMFEGKNVHRRDAVKEFYRCRDMSEVVRKFNVSKGTLEKWIVAYVKSGLAEQDRSAKA